MYGRTAQPAEVARGLWFCADFHDAPSMVGKGWTITGTPIVQRGITLDGSTEYATRGNIAGRINTTGITFVIEFAPTFAANDDTLHYICDTTNGSRYYIAKDASNNLVIYLGNTSIATISSATYAAYWLQNQKNVLVVAGTTGDSDVWLNGTQILTDDTTAWTAANPTVFYLGADYAGANFFAGKIISFKISNQKLTDSECLEYSKGTQFFYSATVDLPCNFRFHDATNGLALDTSGNGSNGTITGCTKSTLEKGYDFDGTDDTIEVTLSGSQTYFSVAAWFYKDVDSGTETIFQAYQSDNTTDAVRVHLYSNTWRINHNSGATTINTAIPVCNGGNALYHCVATVNSSNVMSLYVNGALVYTSAALTIPSYGTKFTFGRSISSILATMFGMKVWEDKVLNAMQVADLYYRELNRIQNL